MYYKGKTNFQEAECYRCLFPSRIRKFKGLVFCPPHSTINAASSWKIVQILLHIFTCLKNTDYMINIKKMRFIKEIDNVCGLFYVIL